MFVSIGAENMEDENPIRYLGYLQQCLSCDKKPLGIFIGAGCPLAVRADTENCPPLIPDIAGITAQIREELAKCKDCGPILKTIEAHFKKDGRLNATVEDMLTHIRALRAVAGQDEVRGLCAAKLDQLDVRICQLIHEIVDQTLPTPETPYHRIASWVDAVRRDNPIEIFTTNYDLLMEQAFEDIRVPYFDGFAGVRKPFFDLRAMEEDMLPPRWARLWKLHGSINWYYVPERGVFRGTTQENTGSMRVIHPSHLKYEQSRRMPYLAMIDRLRAFLKLPTAALIICGYSFRDEHINEVIIQGLECTPSAIAFALLFGAIDNYPQALALANRRFNLSLLAQDGAVVRGQKSKWLEKEAESIVGENNKWIRWVPVEPEVEGGRSKAEFTLVDFAVFGDFLQELVGSVRFSQEGADA